jgi:hypothetical protein
VKIIPGKEMCEIFWNTDTSLVDLLHTINAEEWHSEPAEIDQFNITRIGHHSPQPSGSISHILGTHATEKTPYVRTLRDVWEHQQIDADALADFDPVEFSEEEVGSSIYWASEPIPDVQDDYSNRIRIRLPFPLNDQAIQLFDWYYSNFAPAKIREEYERGGDPIYKITTTIADYSP